MFKLKKKEVTKLAGTSIPSDQKLWPAEVLKALVSQHPYVDTTQVKIAFTRVEPESKAGAGKIIINNSAAIPFSIRPDEKSGRLEMDPLDILYDGEQFGHMDEDSLRRAIDKQQVGRMVKKEDSVPPGNRYVGDMTGDVTPLEWSANPGGVAGPRTAGQGLLSYVIKNQQDVSKLFNILNTYDGINSSLEAMGIRDSLENLKDGMVEGIETKRMAHIIRRPEGGFAVAFDNGDTRGVTAKDLRSVLGPDFEPVMRHVMQRGWAIIRDFPTLRSADSSRLPMMPAPIEIGGRYRVISSTGEHKNALVCDQMIDFDGSVIKNQKAICEDSGAYAEQKAIQGWMIPEVIPKAFDTYKSQTLGARDYPIGEHISKFPIGVLEVGAEGCFIDESWGTPKATPSVRIEKIIEMPGEPPILIARRLDDQNEIGLVVVNGLVRPQAISTGHYDKALMPKRSFYLPAHMSFAATKGKMKLADKQGVAEARPQANLQKNASMYYLFGKTESGDVDYRNMNAEEMRTKLAWLGADDSLLERAMELGSGDDLTLYGLEEQPEPAKPEKVASLHVYSGLIERVKLAAEDAAQGLEQAEEARDPRTVDAILSLQFISDETLEDLMDSGPVFEDCEDRLSRLLLASRQGESSIHERGVQRALRGIGEARKSLKTLEIELDSRET